MIGKFLNLNKRILSINSVNRIIIYIVLAVFLISAEARYADINERVLGFDEGSHLYYANYKNFKEFLQRSYKEVHPPLQYLLINLAYIINQSVLSIRSVALFFGLLLIPSVFFIVKKHSLNRYSSLFSAFVVGFGYLYISLSQGTRSYSLALFCFAILFYYFLKLIKKYDYEDFKKLIIFSSLAIFSDYSALPCIAAINITIIIRHYQKLQVKEYSLFTLELIFVLTQFYLVRLYTFFNPFSTNYGNNQASNFTVILERFFSTVTTNFFNYPLLIYLPLLIIMMGIVHGLNSRNRRNKYILLNVLISIIILLFAHYLKLYPFMSNRYSIVFSTMIFISSLVMINKSIYANLVIFFACLFTGTVFITNYYSPDECGMVKNDGAYITVGYRISDLEKIMSVLKKYKIEKDDFLLSRIRPVTQFFPEEEIKKEFRKSVSFDPTAGWLNDEKLIKKINQAKKIVCVDCHRYETYQAIKKNFKEIARHKMCGNKNIIVYENIS